MTLRPGLAAALVLLLAAGCSFVSSPPPAAPPPAASPRPLTLYALQGREVRLAHVGPADGSGAVATAVGAGRPVGDVRPLPSVLSERHQNALVEAESLYAGQQYAGAQALLEAAYRDEPANPFVLEAYGRVLVRQRERARAFDVYRKLVDQLDVEGKGTAPAVTVDVWFVDAYWKLGTLYMDRSEWERAAFEISRALVGGLMWERLAVDQALSHLTRAYAEMGQRRIARYYAERALEFNPRNPVVRRYLDPLSPDSK